MLYVMDAILLIGCILVFSAGIVWALGSKDYSKNPLHRLYCLLSMAYLKVSEFLVAGVDAFRSGKEERSGKIFGNHGISFTDGGRSREAQRYTAKDVFTKGSGFLKSGQYNLKILK